MSDEPAGEPGPEEVRATAAASTQEAVPAPARERAVISVRTLVSAALITLALVATVFVVFRIFDLVLLFLIAVVVAEGIRPMVEWLERRRFPLAVAISAVYLGLIAVLAITVTILVEPVVAQAQQLASDIQGHQNDIVSFITNTEAQLHISNSDLQSGAQNFITQASNVLLAISGYIVAIIVDFFIVLVVAFLWLTTSRRLKAFTVDLFPLHHQGLASDVIHEIGFRMGGYLRAVAINMVAVGVATGLGCAILQLPSPLLLGIFAGVTAAVPLVGPFLGVVPPVLLALTISPTHAVVTLVVLLVIQLLDGNTVVPVVMNRVVALPPLAVVLALLVGGAVAGLVGALLAVPIASAMQVLVMRVLVPAIHHAQGRTDAAYAGAFTPVSPGLRDQAPKGGGRRREPRP
jgi:predicted PurR-regulated permease PerM